MGTIETAIHNHDCDDCVFIGIYPLRSARYGVMSHKGDLYLTCDNSGYKYIVRYGINGDYITTNNPSTHIFVPIIDGIDLYK